MGGKLLGTHDGTRLQNLTLRRGTPYPLGHAQQKATGVAMCAHAHAGNPDLKPAERAQQTKEHTLDDMPPLPEDELPGASERSSMAGRLR